MRGVSASLSAHPTNPQAKSQRSSLAAHKAELRDEDRQVRVSGFL